MKNSVNGTRLYLHVFNWPDEGPLIVPGMYNDPLKAYLLANPKMTPLKIHGLHDTLFIEVPPEAPDMVNSVVVLDIAGKPDISTPPGIIAPVDIFTDSIRIKLFSDRMNTDIRFTLDGSVPNVYSPIYEEEITIVQTSVLSARCFRNNEPVSGISTKRLTRVVPLKPVAVGHPYPGIRYKKFEGNWDSLPDFYTLTPTEKGIESMIHDLEGNTGEYYALLFHGWIRIPRTGVYTIYLASDDGSSLLIGEKVLIDNDGLHGLMEKKASIALEQGFHAVEVRFFEKTGGDDLVILMEGPGLERQPIPSQFLFH